MRVYKYPPHGTTAQKTRSRDPSPVFEDAGLKMICSRCVVPVLALYVLLEEASAAALPSRFRSKRKVIWLEQEPFPSWLDGSEQRDLSVGDAGEAGRGANDQLSHSETFLPPPERLPVKHQSQNHRRANEKRRKVAPLDSIGSFQMTSFQNRNDEPEVRWEEHKK